MHLYILEDNKDDELNLLFALASCEMMTVLCLAEGRLHSRVLAVAACFMA